MKKLEATIHPHKLSAVQQALLGNGIGKIAFFYGKDTGHVESHPQFYRGSAVSRGYLPMIKIEVIVADDLAQAATASIMNAARTTESGEPMVLMTNVDYATTEAYKEST
jgi:nitrogen regulatory protein P-II 1